MKSKDQILLEQAYSKILRENEDKFQPHDPEMQELSKIGIGEEYPEEDNLEPETEDNVYLYDNDERYDYHVKNFGQKAVDYAYNYMKDMEYSDNLRMAYVDDPKTEKIYDLIKNRGCCGSKDYAKIPTSLTNGREAYFGYNYGH
jgi:hypothetical protein